MRPLILLAALTACAPYHLATNGTAPAKPTTELRTDASTCAQQARDQSPAPAVAFAFGLTAEQSASQKARARAIYADCLTARGWSNIQAASD